MASRAGAASCLLLLLSCYGASFGEFTSQGLSTFVDTLLAEYDREVPPAARTVVSLSLDVRHASVDDRTATMRMLADLKMSWSEPRLTWNSTLWEGDSVLVSLERLWVPDVTLVSSGGGGSGSGEGLRARLSAEGALTAVLRLDLVKPFALQLREWPNDVQQAVFMFASRAHNEDELELLINDDKKSLLVESGAWEVVDVVGATSSWRRGDQASSRAATWTVRAARRGAGHAAAAGTVLTAAMLLLTAAAVLPYAQRPPLAACASFVAALWLVTAIFHMPGSASTPRTVSVMCAVCVCGAVSGAGAVAATRVSRFAAPPTPALRAFLSRVSAVYTFAPDPEAASGCKSGAWAALAQVLDAVLVTALLLTLLVLAAVQLFS